MTAARKIPVEPQPSTKRLSARALLEEAEKRIDVDGLMEAGNKYGDDVDRELAVLRPAYHAEETWLLERAPVELRFSAPEEARSS